MKTITEGVVVRLQGGLPSGSYNMIPCYDSESNILRDITVAGTYYADISHVASCGFYIYTGVENGTLDIEVTLKSGSKSVDLKPIQSLFSKTETLTVGSTSTSFNLRSGTAPLLRYFKFITVCANFEKIKEQITLSTRVRFQSAAANPEVQKEVFNTNRICSDWMPLITPEVVVNLDFAAAASEGDTVYVEVFGIR